MDLQFEQFGDQIGELTKQFTAMGGANGCRHQPNLRFVEEEDKFCIEDEPINPFAESGANRERPWCQATLANGSPGSDLTY